MSPFETLIAISIGVGLIFGGVTYSFVTKKFVKAGALFFGTVVFACSTLVVCIIGFNLTTHFIPDRTVLVIPQKTDAYVQSFEKSTFLWRWDDSLKDTEHISYAPRTVSVRMPVNPITVNPQVLNIIYEVRVGVPDSPEEALRFYQVTGSTDTRGGEMQKWVKWILWEFNKEYSRGLADFRNDADDGLQDRFESLVRDYVRSHFEEAGLDFKNARFSISIP